MKNTWENREAIEACKTKIQSQIKSFARAVAPIYKAMEWTWGNDQRIWGNDQRIPGIDEITREVERQVSKLGKPRPDLLNLLAADISSGRISTRAFRDEHNNMNIYITLEPYTCTSIVVSPPEPSQEPENQLEDLIL